MYSFSVRKTRERPSGLSPERKARLVEDGFVALPGAVPRPLIDAALQGINHRLGPGQRTKTPRSYDEAEYETDYRSEPELLALLNESGLFASAESLLGPGKIHPGYEAQVALRFPASRNAARTKGLAAHVDGLTGDRKGPVERFNMCVGVLLSDLPKEDMGNLILYPGSHRLIAEYVKKNGTTFPPGGLWDAVDMPEPAQFTGKAGDAVFFHYQTAHDKARNHSPHVRYMVYFRLTHVAAWKNASPAYLERGLTDLWFEWSGIEP